MQKDDPAQRDYEAERHALFYTDANARAYYKASNLISTDLFDITSDTLLRDDAFALADMLLFTRSVVTA